MDKAASALAVRIASLVILSGSLTWAYFLRRTEKKEHAERMAAAERIQAGVEKMAEALNRHEDEIFAINKGIAAGILKDAGARS